MNPKFTAIILSGGKSLRIGKDKALLKLNGIAVIDRIYYLLKNIFDDVIIISNNSAKYEYLTNQINVDIYPGFGPLSGIHSGLSNSSTNDNFIMSCDMPLVNEQVIKFILSKNSEYDIILPKTNSTVHSLCGIYKKSCLTAAENLIKTAGENINVKNGRTKIRLFDLIYSVNTNYVNLCGEEKFDEDIMFNMNTREDYEYVKKKMNNSL